MAKKPAVSEDGQWVAIDGEWKQLAPDRIHYLEGADWKLVPGEKEPKPEKAPREKPKYGPQPNFNDDGWPVMKLGKKEAAQLEASLMDGEQVLGQASGRFGQAMVATDRRVLVLKHGTFTGTTFGAKATSFDYRHVTSVEVRTGVMVCILEITAAGVANTVGGAFATGDRDPDKAPNALTFNKSELPAFRAIASRVRELITSGPPVAAAAPSAGHGLDDLERLAELRDKGVITTEDFEAKKRQILGL